MNYNETTMTRKNIFVRKIKSMILYRKRLYDSTSFIIILKRMYNFLLRFRLASILVPSRSCLVYTVEIGCICVCC